MRNMIREGIGGRLWLRLLSGVISALLLLVPARDAGAFQKWPIKQFRIHFGARSDIIETPQMFTDFKDAQVEDIQQLLQGAAKELEAMGFPPPRLVDTTKLDDGSLAYVVYLYDYDGAPARYMYACEGENIRPRIDLNAQVFLEDGKIAAKAFSDTIHELVHAVQRSTELYKKECEPGIWISEGMAEAVGHDIARVLRRSNVEKRGTNRALARWGGRDYAVPLRVGKRTSDNKDLAYQSSSFWRYLAELTDAKVSGGTKPGSGFHETDYSFLPRILSKPLKGSGEEAELQWLHEALSSDPVLGVGLDEVYPDFVSVMAGYGQRIDSALEKAEVRRRWLSVAFNGCHQVGLSPAASADPITVTMDTVTADCIEMRISGRGGKVPVVVNAAHKSAKLVEQLSLSKLGDKQAQRANVHTAGDGTGSATWTFSLDAPGPSYLIISNVALHQPQKTNNVAIDLAFSIGEETENSSRSTYESLLPPLPAAIRRTLLEEFDAMPAIEKERIIAKLKAK